MPKPRRHHDEAPEPAPTIETSVVSSRVAVTGGLATFAVIALLLVATGPSLAIVWDEGYTLGREDRIRAWFAALRDPSGFRGVV